MHIFYIVRITALLSLVILHNKVIKRGIINLKKAIKDIKDE